MKIPSLVSLKDGLDMGLSLPGFCLSFLLSGEEEERLTERVKKEVPVKGNRWNNASQKVETDRMIMQGVVSLKGDTNSFQSGG